MNYLVYSSIVSFIWKIADDVLRDYYSRSKYRDVILPMTVIRRIDAILEPTKQDVLKMKKQMDDAGITNQDAALCQASGYAFYNTSPFTLRDLMPRARQQQLKADFEAYLNGFSSNIQEILSRFKFHDHIPFLAENDLLGFLIEKFLDPKINLNPEPVYDTEGNIVLPGLDNHAMGTVFEELIRRFNEDMNEETGEHFTSRDVVNLMANLIFYPIADQLKSGTYLVYDGACGTGGMLTIAEKKLYQLAKQQGKELSIHLYGQEVNPETYAIAKADLLIKGEGEEADNIKYGSTLSTDAFPSREFDFMLSNPPYGKSWKMDLQRLGGKGDIKDPRFVVTHEGEHDFNLVTRSSDGQMMFLANKLSKMKNNTPMGSRIAEVHNGSSLFTGDAGQGESNIRRWIIENDWLEAIIALPKNMFYNTGIATYIWVISNRKPENRKGKVQLIDASEWYEPLRKNLGQKNCEFSDRQIQQICDLFMAFEETEQSKIFNNGEFGYWKVTVERPLRLKIELSDEKITKFRDICKNKKAEQLIDVIEFFKKDFGEGPFLDYNTFISLLEEISEQLNINFSKKYSNLIMKELAEKDESAEPVIKKIHKSKKTELNSLYGLYEREIEGKKRIVEFETDSDLRDYEQVPLLEEGGIESFFEREVLPYVPDAWVDESKTKIGYEISFTRYFYKPIPLRSLDEIRSDILAVEKETEGLLEEIIGGLK